MGFDTFQFVPSRILYLVVNSNNSSNEISCDRLLDCPEKESIRSKLLMLTGSVPESLLILIIIELEAGEIIRLVTSVCLYVTRCMKHNVHSGTVVLIIVYSQKEAY